MGETHLQRDSVSKARRTVKGEQTTATGEINHHQLAAHRSVNKVDSGTSPI